MRQHRRPHREPPEDFGATTPEAGLVPRVRMTMPWNGAFAASPLRVTRVVTLPSSPKDASRSPPAARADGATAMIRKRASRVAACRLGRRTYSTSVTRTVNAQAWRVTLLEELRAEKTHADRDHGVPKRLQSTGWRGDDVSSRSCASTTYDTQSRVPSRPERTRTRSRNSLDIDRSRRL